MIMIIVIMMMIMNMMVKIKMVITWPIIKLGDPHFAWQQIQIIPTDDNNNNNDEDDECDDDYEHYDEDQNGRKSANFQAMSLRFRMVVDLDNTPAKIPMMMMIIIMLVRMMMMMMINIVMKIKWSYFG